MNQLPPVREQAVPRQKVRAWNQVETLMLPALKASASDNQTPMFSVCIVVRNRPEMLRNAVRSVLASTCDDFELVIVDDGSDVSVASDLASVGLTEDPRVRIIRQPPLGISPARNLALYTARGSFITVLDSDDELTPDGLSLLREFITMTGCQWVYTNYEEVTERTTRVIEVPGYLNPRKMTRAVLARPRLPFKHSGMTLRRDLMLDLGGYDEHIRIFEDIELVLHGLQAGHHLVRLDRPIVRFHRHDGNVSHQFRLHGIMVWFDLISKFGADRPPGLKTGLKMLRTASEIGKWLVRIAK